MTYRELRCEELVEIITGYLEGSLDDASRAEVERHLAYCPGCSGYLDEMRATISLMGRLHADDVPAAAMSELLAAFRAEPR